METQTVEQVRTARVAGPGSLVTDAAAVAFIIGAAWFMLVNKGVTVASAPPAQQGLRAFYRWLATTLPQERFYISIAIAGFIGLIAAAFSLKDLPGFQTTPARVGTLLTGAGSMLWISGNVLVLGGHSAVGMMATHANPIQATNSIAFTVDTVGNAFALAAFALIGAGMLSFASAARQARQARPAQRAWPGYTIIVALVMVVTAGSFAVGNSSFADLMVFISGVAALPVWLLWTGRSR